MEKILALLDRIFHPPGIVRVLVIEDNNSINSLLKSQLEKDHAYHVIYSVTGKKGLRMAHLRKPDIILLDIGLPDIDGLEVLEMLKKDSITKNIPVIMLTANRNAETFDKATRMGAYDYLTKPVKVAQLKQRFDDLLRTK